MAEVGRLLDFRQLSEEREQSFYVEGIKSRSSFLAENLEALLFLKDKKGFYSDISLTPFLATDCHCKTPLNYTGNKSRLLHQFNQYFPKKTDVFVDLFCGGATVGLNANTKKVFFIDKNENVIKLLKHLSRNDFGVLLKRLENIINKYKLSFSAKHGYSYYRRKLAKKDNNGLKEINKQGFYDLRQDYNYLSDKYTSDALDMLYILMVYGFNNDIRFNKNGHYNLPVGKTDLNSNNLKKLSSFTQKIKSIDCVVFIHDDFRSEKVRNILTTADFIYADPPYLLGNATYNESGGWTEKDEIELLNLLSVLEREGKSFALSNILSKSNRKNEILTNWLSRKESLKVIDIDYHYRSASYNKKDRNAQEKEVLIISLK